MDWQASAIDTRIQEYIQAAEQLRHGNFEISFSNSSDDPVGQLGTALMELAHTLEMREDEVLALNEITAQINAGLLLEEILDRVYSSFRKFIPYNRIGFSILEDECTTVRAYWAKSDQSRMYLTKGYLAPISGSSLETILRTRQPRIINDLVAYSARKPASISTALMLKEGIRSSLTCPLFANNQPIGFIFFSSSQVNAYNHEHVAIFQQIAGQLSIIVEKGRLVSELAKQKLAIEQQNIELRHLMELRNSFLGMAAHDLRNPIGNIQTVAELLMSPHFAIREDEQKVFLHNIIQQTQYMLSLLNDILDISHIESGKFSITLVNFPVREFLQDVVERHNRLAEPKGTKISLEVENDGEVTADPLRLSQVMDNLLSNAVKFSPPGAQVVVRLHDFSDHWRIEVQDEGPGIAPEERDRLFQEFVRLSARPTANEKSTGLGLAISRRVVQALGGQIGVDSKPGSGATFWFTLPHRRMETPA